MALVSIVIPAFNAERYLAETIGSVFSQSLDDWRLIVVNNGSVDGTGHVALASFGGDPRCSLLDVETNAGVGNGRNAGFREVESEFTMFLDADDLLEPLALEKLIQSLHDDLSSIGSHGLVAKVDERGAPLGRNGHDWLWPTERICVTPSGRGRVMKASEPTTIAALAVDCWICTPGAALVRTSALIDEMQRHPKWAGPWRPGETGSEDRDIFARLALHGNFAFRNESLIRYRQHNASMTNEYGNENILRREQYLLEHEIARTEVERKMFEAGWRARSLVRARLQLGWSRDEVARRDVPRATRHFAHFIGSYLRYLRVLPLPDWRTL